MADLIQIRRDSSTNWESVNPTLAVGEIGFITDNNTPGNTGSISFKVGDGTHSFNQMPEQTLVRPETITNLSASNAATDTRLTEVSGSLSGSIAAVDQRLTNVSGSIDSRINEVSQSIGEAISGTLPEISQSISASSAELNGRIDGVEQDIEENYAKQDGYYSQMSVGLSENLISPDGVTDNAPYVFRTSAGDASISTGYATLEKMEGHTVKFNQLVQNRYSTGSGTVGSSYVSCFSFPFSELHYFYIAGNITTSSTNANLAAVGSDAGGSFKDINGSSVNGSGRSNLIAQLSGYDGTLYIRLKSAAGSNVSWEDLTCFDLTSMFGTDAEIAAALGIETSDITTDTGVAAFEAWLAKNVGYKDYYPYTDGKLVSVNVDGLKTVGFNQWDEEWEVGFINSEGVVTPNANSIRSKNFSPCFPSTNYYIKGGNRTVVLKWYDINYNFISTSSPNTVVESPVDARYFKISVYDQGATYNHDICINLSWSGYRNGEYEPYWTETLDLEWIKSLKDTNDNQLFPYGLLSAGSVRDEVTATKAIKRVGVVDLGDLTWQYQSGTGRMLTTLADAKVPSNNYAKANIITLKYVIVSSSETETVDKTIGLSIYGNLAVRDSYYGTDYAAFKTAMNGVMLYYELATPIEIDITPVENMNYKVDDFGTEEFVSSALTTPQTAAPYQTTHYMDNLRDKLRNIDKNFVSATQDQTEVFTDLQKAQARENIGAGTVNPTDVCPQMTVGAAKNLVGHGTVGAEYTFRTSGGNADIGTGTATIDVMKGKTLKFNQLISHANEPSIDNGWSVNNGTLSNGVFTATAQGGYVATPFYPRITHKILLIATIKTDAPAGSISIYTGNVGDAAKTNIASAYYQVIYDMSRTWGPSGGDGRCYIMDNRSSNWTPIEVKSIILVDLTLMFGAGNEPTTVAEFEALYPLDYYAYTATPVLINNAASGIVTTGFNQFDADTVWSNNPNITHNSDGSWTGTIGVMSEAGPLWTNDAGYTGQIYISKQSSATGGSPYIRVNYTDNTVDTVTLLDNSSLITSATKKVWYIKISYGSGTNERVTIKDLCINFSWSGYRNGEYEPYEKHTLYFNGESGSLATVTGKKLVSGVPTGESVTIFPDGMKSAGSVYDFGKADSDGYIRKVTKKIGVIADAGTLNWQYSAAPCFYVLGGISDMIAKNSGDGTTICAKYELDVIPTSSTLSGMADKKMRQVGIIIGIRDDSYQNDPTAFATAMSGVPLYYELATPEEYLLDTPIPANYLVNDFGTEQRIPTDTSSSVQAPICYEVKYAMNATDTVRRLPINYISVDSMENFTAELASKLGTFLSASISITSSYDATNQEYDYTITITPNA